MYSSFNSFLTSPPHTVCVWEQRGRVGEGVLHVKTKKQRYCQHESWGDCSCIMTSLSTMFPPAKNFENINCLARRRLDKPKLHFADSRHQHSYLNAFLRPPLPLMKINPTHPAMINPSIEKTNKSSDSDVRRLCSSKRNANSKKATTNVLTLSWKLPTS